jgi:hypothetical protein
VRQAKDLGVGLLGNVENYPTVKIQLLFNSIIIEVMSSLSHPSHKEHWQRASFLAVWSTLLDFNGVGHTRQLLFH